MYSSSELCGNADLLRKIFQYAADGHNGNGVAESAGQDLNPQPTVAFGENYGTRTRPQTIDLNRTGHFSRQHFEDQDSHSLFVQPIPGSHAWPDPQFPRRDSAISSALTLHQPVPHRPVAQSYSMGLQFSEPGYLQFKMPAAHQALADLTNKEHTLDFPDRDAEDKSEDDDIEALHASCSPFGLENESAFRSTRHYDSDPTAGYFSEPCSSGELERPRTLGSQDSAWTELVPRYELPLPSTSAGFVHSIPIMSWPSTLQVAPWYWT